MSDKREWSNLETGTVNGGREVDFRTSNDGHTLIADHDVNQGNSATFDTQRDSSGNKVGGTGQHDHYGSGNGRNDNGTDRGYYNGPGSSSSSSDEDDDD